MKNLLRILFRIFLFFGCAWIGNRFLHQDIDFYNKNLILFNVQAASQAVTAHDLITMENESRAANGLAPLKVDENIMKCAQDTADKMAYYHMNGHIGDVRNRISSFGYNNYYECWATENWWLGRADSTLDEIRQSWGDQPHMIPAENPLYCHIGAGIAEADDGTVYFVLQAAYPAFKAGCDYVKPEVAEIHGLKRVTSGGSGIFNGSDLIYKVITTTPDTDGKTWHTVKQGQALWHIANAYGTTVDELAFWNHIGTDTLLQMGQKLLIPGEGSAPTTLPTLLPTMGADGTFRHTVKQGETIWSIAKMWNIDIDRLLSTNGLNQESVINIGWNLWIPVTPTITSLPSSTLSPTATGIPNLAKTETPPDDKKDIITQTASEKEDKSKWLKAGSILLGFLGMMMYCIFKLIRK